MRIDMQGSTGSWPIGSALRFRLDAPLQAKYRHLRGTYVRVQSTAVLRKCTDGKKGWAVTQKVFAYSFGGSGWANPDFLEPHPNDPLPAKKIETKAPKSEVGECLAT